MKVSKYDRAYRWYSQGRRLPVRLRGVVRKTDTNGYLTGKRSEMQLAMMLEGEEYGSGERKY